MQSTPIAIRVCGANFSYQASEGDRRPVLRDLSLTVPYGQIVGIAGRNASGKSTLLRLIRGDVIPQKGTVTTGDEKVSQDGHAIHRPEVALISQKPDATLGPSLTVYENFVLSDAESGHLLSWAYRKSLRDKCRGILQRAEMGLEDKLEEQARFLSGGQQQALSVLLALEQSARILLLDEPTAALDVFAGNKVMEMTVRETRDRLGCALLVSHRLDDLVEWCDRLLILSEGCIVQDLDTRKARIDSSDIVDFMV